MGTSASTFNFGQDGTFAGAKTAQGNSDGNNIGNFIIVHQVDFQLYALRIQGVSIMAAPTIIKGEEQFFNIVYEGNGTGQKVGLFVPFTDSGTIANSCIFNVADSPNLNRTISSGSQRRIFTVSFG